MVETKDNDETIAPHRTLFVGSLTIIELTAMHRTAGPKDIFVPAPYAWRRNIRQPRCTRPRCCGLRAVKNDRARPQDCRQAVMLRDRQDSGSELRSLSLLDLQ